MICLRPAPGHEYLSHRSVGSYCGRIVACADDVHRTVHDVIQVFFERESSFFSACQDGDIVITTTGTNYRIHAVLPRGMQVTGNEEHMTLFMENPNNRARTEIARGDVVCALGEGEFSKQDQGRFVLGVSGMSCPKHCKLNTHLAGSLFHHNLESTRTVLWFEANGGVLAPSPSD
jgi:hypothetical protein